MRLLLIPCVLFAALFAQEPPRERPNFIRFHPLLSALDKDGDGMISTEEMAGAPAALAKLDANQDGKISMEEMRPARFGGRGGPGERGEARPPDSAELVKTLMAFDANGDGKLSKAEVPERMQGLFDRADADKDGVLTAEELNKLAASQAGPDGQGGEGPRRRGGMRMDPVMAALDADQDGVLSADEIKNAGVALKKLDKNGDGKITEDEVRPNFGPGGFRR